MSRPTVYTAPTVAQQETIYKRLTVYNSATVYREFVDTQEWDEDDVPPNMSLEKIPVDSVGWEMDAEIKSNPQPFSPDSVGWEMDVTIQIEE